MPYRGRALKRIKGQRKLKAGAPIAKFTMTKNFELSADNAHSSTYMLGIDCSTPFQPIFSVNNNSAQPLGDWNDNDTSLEEPVGLDSDLYSNYNYLVVKGMHATASVSQAPDVAAIAQETLTTGQITLARTSELIDTNAKIPTSADIKQWFGQKTRNFQLGNSNEGVLTKNAYVSNGYSAKKQWNVQANANEDLRVSNVSGSANTSSQKTYMYLIVKPRKDLPADGSAYLKPTNITLKLTYIIQFQDPDKVQSVPLPMSTNKTRKAKARKMQSRYQMYNTQAAAPAIAGLGGLAALMYGARGRRRPRLIHDNYRFVQ